MILFFPSTKPLSKSVTLEHDTKHTYYFEMNNNRLDTVDKSAGPNVMTRFFFSIWRKKNKI